MSRDVVGNFFYFMNRTHLAEIFAKERAPCCADSALANTARNRQKNAGFAVKNAGFAVKNAGFAVKNAGLSLPLKRMLTKADS